MRDDDDDDDDDDDGDGDDDVDDYGDDDDAVAVTLILRRLVWQSCLSRLGLPIVAPETLCASASGGFRGRPDIQNKSF